VKLFATVATAVFLLLFSLFFSLAALFAEQAETNPGSQDKSVSSPQMPDMPGMKMGNEKAATGPPTFVEEIEHHSSAGTSAEPSSTPALMLMAMRSSWMLMFHANAFVLDQQQSSSRGGNKFFSTNWFMGMAQHPLGPGVLTFRAMLSLEPATVTGRQYPLLFQQEIGRAHV
jgi:hypothetical protein